MAVVEDDEMESFRSTATGLPTVMTSINERGDGGDSKNIRGLLLRFLIGVGLPVRGSIQVLDLNNNYELEGQFTSTIIKKLSWPDIFGM